MIPLYSMGLHLNGVDFSKPPVQNKKTETISQMVASFLTSIVRLIDQLADTNTHVLALTESSKLIPYISHRRRPMKLYLKVGR